MPVTSWRRIAWLLPVVAVSVTAIALALIFGNVEGGFIVVALVALGAVIAQIRFDQTVAVTVLVGSIYLLPARLSYPSLGTGGTAAGLLCLAAFGIWCWGRSFGRSWSSPGPQPLRTAMLLLVVAILASYLAMGFRPHDALEGRAADRGLILLVETLGITLLVADCVPDRRRLQSVVRAVALCGGIVAAFGVVEFFTKINIPGYLRIPGLSVNTGAYADERAGFTRIISTTSHPIELSVVLAALLPLALYVAVTVDKARRRLWWAVTGTIVIALPLTISRTAIAGLVIGLAVMAVGWDGRRRRNLLLAIPPALLFFYIAAPGLIGSLRSLIFNSGNDPSITSRQAGYDYVATFFEQSPLFGRGWQTFIPQRYEFLDNQFLLGVVEVGVVGVLALLAALATAIGQAVIVRRRSSRFDDRELALSLIASLLVSLTSWFTYDALSFPSGRMTTFVCAGLAAALWRVVRAEGLAATPAADAAPVPSSLPPAETQVP